MPLYVLAFLKLDAVIHRLPVQALWANVRSLLAAHDVHAATVRASTINYRPHSMLHLRRSNLTEGIQAALAQHDSATALRLAQELGRLAEDALLYLQRYHWKVLYATVVATYGTWIVALLIYLFGDGPVPATWVPRRQRLQAGLASVTVATAAVLTTLTLPVCSSCRPHLLPERNSDHGKQVSTWCTQLCTRQRPDAKHARRCCIISYVGLQVTYLSLIHI